jgi:hypothetical protein
MKPGKTLNGSELMTNKLKVTKLAARVQLPAGLRRLANAKLKHLNEFKKLLYLFHTGLLNLTTFRTVNQ